MKALISLLKFITLCLLLSPAGVLSSIDAQQKNRSHEELKMSKAEVIEIVIYATKAGVTEAEHKSKAAKITNLLAKFDGFISRHFTQESSGKWIDLVYWKDMNSALNAAEVFVTLPESQEYLAEIDEQTIQFMHTKILAEVGTN